MSHFIRHVFQKRLLWPVRVVQVEPDGSLGCPIPNGAIPRILKRNALRYSYSTGGGALRFRIRGMEQCYNRGSIRLLYDIFFASLI